MNLYLITFSHKYEYLDSQKWLETNSLREINKFIMDNPYKEDLCFPLLNLIDKELLETKGNTVLLYSDVYYYLHDMDHENNKSIWRDININSIFD